jgi:phosphoribosyl 1,2-cyclic phosphodiesterase
MEVTQTGPKKHPAAAEAERSVYSLVFVGTGVSTAVPVIGHVDCTCACADAIANPSGPNRRNNVSCLIRRFGSNVLVDAGKTFRDAYFRTLLPRRITTLDAVLLTHDHADAIFGLDDLRDFQTFRRVDLSFICERPLPVYLSLATLTTVSRGFDYIIAASQSAGSAHEDAVLPPTEVVMARRSACFRLRTIDDSGVRPIRFDAGTMDGVPFFSVPVFHGGDYRCLGFAFGESCRFLDEMPCRALQSAAADAAGPCVLYLSDVSSVPEEVLAMLDRLSPIDVLVVDMLLPSDKHFSHFSVEDAWQLILRLQPRHAYGVGMYCEIEHEPMNATLAEKLATYRATGVTSRIESVSLAFDGLEVPLRA